VTPAQQALRCIQLQAVIMASSNQAERHKQCAMYSTHLQAEMLEVQRLDAAFLGDTRALAGVGTMMQQDATKACSNLLGKQKAATNTPSHYARQALHQGRQQRSEMPLWGK
jgi:hypothetical protein